MAALEILTMIGPVCAFLAVLAVGFTVVGRAA